LCIVSTILFRNPELQFKDKLDLDVVVTEAVSMFIKDLGQKETAIDHQRRDSMEPALAQFYNATGATTNGYLARAVVNTVLRGDLGAENTDDSEESCRVS